MSRLLGIVNPNVDPADPFQYWIWQAMDIPTAAEWDYERLNIYTTPAPDQNVCVWVTGPPTEKHRDGIFLKMYVGEYLKPTPRTTADVIPPEVQSSYDTAAEHRTAILPLAGMR
jgi:hypothetical protein